MGIQTSVRNMLRHIADRLGLTIQDEKKQPTSGDYLMKSENISFTDMMTLSLANTECLDFTLPIGGDNMRALWLNKLADDYVNLKLVNTVQTTFNTGDSITVPFYNGRNIQNILVDANNFIITKRFGDEVTGVTYLADECKVKDDTYTLLQSITLEEATDELGNTYSINRYKLYVGKNGEPFPGVPSAINQAWAYYNVDWYIPGADRLLIGRLKSHTNDPKRPNPVKGIPICVGATKPIAELHYLYDQFHVEFVLSEKFVAADKTMFEAKRTFGKDKNGKPMRKGQALPRGKNRVVQEVSVGGMSIEGSSQPFMKEYSPDIRNTSYSEAIQEQYKLFENCVGVSEGVVSRIDTANYENVDNVRKSMRKTQSFINAARKAAEQFLEDLVYAWDVLANYYEINPAGAYEIQYNWSDEYINTFNDRMQGLIQGESVGAVSAEDIRAYLFNEPPEVAAQKVATIRSQQALTAGASLIAEEAGSEAVAGGAAVQDIALSLSPSQFQEAMKLLDRYNAGELDREDAIERLSLIGVTRAKAETLLRERVNA